MRSPRLTWIRSDDPPEAFPDIESDSDLADGLIAAGGDLSTQRLLYAYRHGLFPWYDSDQPILWWSPDPRCVVLPESFRISRRTRRSLNNCKYRIQFNTAFSDVVDGCAKKRPGQPGTWITPDMRAAYQALHDQNWAHSIEVWNPAGLVGGLYGLAIGRVFFGESMFSLATNASKAAMLALCQVLLKNNFALLDCQVESPHLMTLGATLMPRRQFAATLEIACRQDSQFTDWPEASRDITEFLPAMAAGALQ
jgi:leucyl/phenylalanyl-tRNA--protein transferase